MKRAFLSLFVLWCTLCGMSKNFILTIARHDVSQVANEYNASVKGLDRCAENGKYADQFTIDRRCYVTDEQKNKFPYNTVVSLQYWPTSDNKSLFCTGVIIKNPYDSKLYIYTAGHCIDDNTKEAFAMTQDKKIFPVTKIVKKNLVWMINDYAVYSIPQEYQNVLPYTTTAEGIDADVDMIGYGMLEILSDNAIRKAKQEWKNMLNFASGDRKKILNQVRSYTELLPNDVNLKASFDCNPYKIIDSNNFCQGYPGNSGGPIFNKNGKVGAVASWMMYNDFADDKYIRFTAIGMQPVSTIDYVMNSQIGVVDAQTQQRITDSHSRQTEQEEFHQQMREMRQLNRNTGF